MGILQITLFGGVRATYDNWLTELKLTREIQSLLAYLLLHRNREHHREVLAGIFWGKHSQERARGSLNTALWKLKKVIEPIGTPAGTYLTSNYPGEVGFNRKSQYWLDVEVFEKEMMSILALPPLKMDEHCVRKIEKNLRLYKGELLEGFYYDWAIQERERLRSLYLKSMMHLFDCFKFHELYEQGISYGQQILNLDPLREEIHREMMKLYLGNGQRALAARQYEICRYALDKELGIEPMEDTQKLYRQIISVFLNHQSPEITNEQITLAQAIEQLRQTKKTLDMTQRKIDQALKFIERYAEGQ